jgi:hypothetical protein
MASLLLFFVLLSILLPHYFSRNVLGIMSFAGRRPLLIAQ